LVTYHSNYRFHVEDIMEKLLSKDGWRNDPLRPDSKTGLDETFLTNWWILDIGSAFAGSWTLECLNGYPQFSSIFVWDVPWNKLNHPAIQGYPHLRKPSFIYIYLQNLRLYTYIHIYIYLHIFTFPIGHTPETWLTYWLHMFIIPH
jgi:hypothetical protein